MRNSCFSLFLGLTATAVVLTPITVQAATFDYSKVKNWTARPIESDYVLDFFGDISQNQGYTLVNNLDPNAPDAGHISIAQNALATSGYYTMGRPASPAPNDSTRSATLQSIKGYPNLSNYLNSNNIPLSSIGYSYGQKEGRDFTQAASRLGEDKLGQDWFASPDSPIEERIYRTNAEDAEDFLIFGTTKIVNLGYSPFYFAADNGPTPDVGDNFNVFLNDPVPVSKAAGLDPLASGLADAFLQDVAAAGDRVQILSEDSALRATSLEYNGYDVTYVNFPLQLSAVGSRNIPEPSFGLGLLMFGALVTVSRMKQQKKIRTQRN